MLRHRTLLVAVLSLCAMAGICAAVFCVLKTPRVPATVSQRAGANPVDTSEEASIAPDGSATTGMNLSPPACYRLDDHVGEATVESTSPNTTDNGSTLSLVTPEAKWSTGNESSVWRFDGGLLQFTTQGRDYIETPSDFNYYGPEIDAVVLRMTVSGADEVQLSWRSMGVEQKWCDEGGRALTPIHIPEQGKEQEYLIKLGGLPTLQGRKIDGMRLIVPKSATVAIRTFDIRARASLFSGNFGSAGYRLGNSLRRCLYMKGPSQIAYALRLPENARFSASLATVADSQPVTFSLSVSTPEGDVRCFTQQAAGCWNDISYDLSRYANMQATIRLRVECDPPGAFGLWANPVIYRDASRQEAAAQPNILFYVVDSLRADHLELYGYERPTAPALNDLAHRGLWFKKCLSPATCTRPSMVSMFTGVEAIVHGLDCYDATEPVSLAVFPEALRDAGYDTAAFTENPNTPPEMPQRHAFCYIEDFDAVTASQDGSTFNAVTGFMKKNRGCPFFVYVHTMECHVQARSFLDYQYDPPPSYENRWAKNKRDHANRYDECIRFADDNFARILASLKESGLDANTLVIFTSDHGEGFLQHLGGIWHGYEPYDELAGVPLVMYWPKGIVKGHAVDANVQGIDLPPTLFEILGLPALDQFQGTSLLPFLRGESPKELAHRILFSYQGLRANPETVSICVMKDSQKLLGTYADKKKALYDLALDPKEMNDRSADDASTKAELESALQQHWAPVLKSREKYLVSHEVGGVQTIDPELREKLDSLGYFK